MRVCYWSKIENMQDDLNGRNANLRSILPLNDKLVLTWQPHVKNPDPNDAGRATLLDGITNLTVSYYISSGDHNAGGWSPEISSPEPPSLVRVDLDLGKNRFWSPLVAAPNIESLSAN